MVDGVTPEDDDDEGSTEGPPEPGPDEEVISEAIYTKEEIATSSLVISNKRNLHDYFVDDFATLFFTQGKYVQQRLRIVGPVRLRTIHTLE
jgi:hypothetical protein